MSLLVNISETKHVIKKLSTDIIVTSKVLIVKSKRKYIALSFNISTFYPNLHYLKFIKLSICPPDAGVTPSAKGLYILLTACKYI